MRDIKFRGLRVKYNPDWHKSKFIYGNLLNKDSIGEVGAGLDSYTYAEIIPLTVGQYTGLKDKNGVEIYEGDILCKIKGWLNIVYWSDDLASWRYQKRYNDTIKLGGNLSGIGAATFEVIGNIHQNKELLK